MAQPRLVLIDPDGSQRGELWRVPDVTLDQDINAPSRISFTMDQNDPLVQYVEERRSRVKLYRVADGDTDGVLIGNYRIWNCRDAFSGADGRLEVTAVDDLYVALSRRTLQAGVSFASTDKSLIAKSLIDTQNARSVTTGIRTSSIALPTVGSASVDWPRDKQVGECFAEIADSIPEFEYAVAPIDADSGYTSDLVIASQLGISNLEVFFEWGPGTVESVDAFDRDGEADHFASHTHLIGATEGAAQFRSDSGDDALAVAEGILVDRVFTATDITNQSLLDGGVAEIASNVSDTRRPLNVTVSQTYAKKPFDDYGLGDFVSVRINAGRVDLSGSLRIWGWNIVWTSDAQERVTLRLEDEDTGS